jgi:tetratricopeptide (TPR) repeat protein/tRNA A-37 threonylcarbamoyl transferase component Bud32
LAHLDEQTLTEYAAGALAATARLEANEHLEKCQGCNDLLRQISDTRRGSTMVGARKAEVVTEISGSKPRPTDPEAPPLDRGKALGRYVLLERLGAGGMGEVFAAFDPQLDRKVALKLLRAGVLGADEGRQRLLREAQAMARLAHPNVSAVHDVGTFEDRVFIAMEFVDGDTLTQWLRAGRSWQATLEMFLAAGRGLSAAHKAGLVHRDFKPDNVLIGREDGRPRVLDFGLARQTTSGITEASQAAQVKDELETPITHSALETPITRVGAIMGTPGYMSLEQLQGLATDARTDQFSFCVALFEALYGARPFTGGTLAAHVAAIIKGELPAPPDGSRVPPWVRAVLERGLAASPERRFASMDELLAALTRVSRRGRNRLLGAAAALALVGLGSASWAVTSSRRQAALCAGLDRKLTGVWDDERKKAVHAAFLSTAKPYAEDAWRGVERALDGYSREWVAMSSQACEANRVRGSDTDEVFALRTLCLEDHLKEVHALVDLYVQADAEVVSNAVSGARALADVKSCADLAALTAHRATASPAEREAVHGKLIAAKALHDSGKYKRGVEVAAAAQAEALRLKNRALIAEASFLLGKLQDKAGDPKAAEGTLFDAAVAAEASREDELAVRAWARLAVVAMVQAHVDASRQWATLAGAAMERAGKNDALEAELDDRLGTLALAGKKNDEALAYFTQSLALLEKGLGGDHPEMAIAYNNIGVALAKLGRTGEALASYEKALALHRGSVGDEHPNVVSAVNNIGVLLARQGDYEKAEARFLEALRIREKTLDPQHPELAASEQSLGNLYLKMGRYDEAQVHHRRALAIREKVYGPSHPMVAESLDNLGDIAERRQEYSQALTLFQAALDIYVKQLGPEHSSVASAHENLGTALKGLKQFDKAQAELDTALALRVKRLGAEHVDVARSYRLLGELAVARGATDRALVYFQRSLAIRERNPADAGALAAILMSIGRTHAAQANAAAAVPYFERAVALREKGDEEADLAEARFALAMATWDAKQDRARSVALAGQAREGFGRQGARGKEHLAQVDAWLSRHAEGAAKESP